MTDVVTPDDLHPSAQRLATTIAQSPPGRVARAKSSLWGLRQCGLDDGCAHVTHQLADQLA